MKADALPTIAAALTSAELVSFDLWDTVLRRHCHPDAVKLLAAVAVLEAHVDIIHPSFRDALSIWRLRRSWELRLARRARLSGYSAEFHVQAVWQAVAAEIGEAADCTRLTEAAVALEFDIECRMTWVDADWRRLAESLGGKQVFYLSDFYMGRPMLDRLLAVHELRSLLPTGYVSCDEMASKHDGTLYARVRERLQLQGRRWMHVGDNEHSDVAMARRHGVEAWLFQPEAGHGLRRALEQRFTLRMRNMDQYWLSRLAAARGEDAAIRLGRRFAPLFAGFALHTLQHARKLGVDKIAFLTREGEFFKAAYDRLLAVSGERGPPSVLLSVSRVATFAASLAAPSLDELQRLWSQYSRQSPAALLRSLGASPEHWAHWFLSHGLAMDVDIARPARDPRMQALFADAEFCAALAQLLLEKRLSLCAYLQQQGLAMDDPAPVLLVDIGWRGTIQDNLARVQPQRHWHGLYLGLFPPLNAQPANTDKQAYLVDLRSDYSWRARQLLSFAVPFEMLSNSARGSVLAYAGADVIEDVQDGELVVFNQFTRYFQQGVLHGIEACVSAVAQDGVGAAEMRQQALKLADELIYRPDPLFVRAVQQLSHNESFGLGQQLRFDCQLTSPLIVRALFSQGGWRALRQALAATPWKSALMHDPATPLPVRAVLRAEAVVRQAKHWLSRWRPVS